MPGVVAVLTHEDVPDVLYGQLVQDRRLFAKDRVRFEGDIVAGVAALTEEIASEAAAAIDVEYEPLQAGERSGAALAADAPLIHDEWQSYKGESSSGETATRLLFTRSSRATPTRRWRAPKSS